MNRLRALLREPLLHFLVLGAALFLLHGLIAGRDGPAEFTVSAGQVQRLADGWQRVWRRPPSAAELAALIEDHLREEVLYREALALGLDQDDTIIRRRLRQKMEFIGGDVAPPEPGEADLQAYLAAHPERFREPARLAFRQVFLDRERPDAEAEAGRLLTRVAAYGTGPVPATLGDPTLLAADHAAITEPEVEAMFGPAFAAALLQAPVGRWSGPVASPYGLHLVLVRERAPGRLPPLDEVREAVRRAWQAARAQEAGEAFYRELRARYQVTVEQPVPAPTP